MGADLLGNSKPWELSLYELNRTPQELITDETEIAVNPRSLHSELMCPICLDMLNSTMTTKECLHRFCQGCITTALRSGNKECPTCRKKLVSRRSLRPDPNFDELISKIYPNREEYEAHHEKMMAKLSKQTVGSSFDDKLNDINRNQKLKKVGPENGSHTLNGKSDSSESQLDDTYGKRKSKANNPELDSAYTDFDGEDTEAENSHSATSVSSCDGNSQQEVELVFKPLTQDESTDSSLMQIRFIKTTINATVDHLVKYMSMRHMLDSKLVGTAGEENHKWNNISPESSLFALYIAAGPGQFQPLLGQMTLEQINEKYWRFNKPLELFYRVRKPENDY